jgi:hypothetical protein
VSVAPARVLRWSYVKQDQRCHCELTLDADHRLYELRVWRGLRATPSVESYRHVHKAVERQSELEALLLEEGFSLEFFQRVTTMLARTKTTD